MFFSIIITELVFNSVDKFAFHVKFSTILIFGGSVLMCFGKFNDCTNTCKKTRKSCREILNVCWILIFITLNNHGSSGGIMTKPPNFFPRGQDIFLSQRPDCQWESPSLLSTGYRAHFPPRVNWQQLQADHSPPSGAEGKNEWSYASAIPYVLMTSCLIKHNFVFSNV